MPGTLAQVLPAVSRSLGVPLSASLDAIAADSADSTQLPEIPNADAVVVCLIDGLGWHQLLEFAAVAPALDVHRGTWLDSVFPTTTAAALASLGTGLAPGGHGLVGATFRLPETGSILHPLHWESDPLPAMVQPEPTMFQMLMAAGVHATTVAPAAYERSGLTQAALRGPQYRSAESVDDRIRAVRDAVRRPGKSVTYVYWPDLDRLGHRHGVGSEAWLSGLAQVDRLVTGLRCALTPRAMLLVTADHGMVNCPPKDRIVIEAHAELLADVTDIAGEPRARHVYVTAGREGAALDRWTSVLGTRARVLSREEIVESGILGVVEPGIDERIGDLVAVPEGTWTLASAVDRQVSALLGQHGGWTAAERAVPLLACVP